MDDWQRWWLHHALSENAAGDWCARETVLITGRQSGKNGGVLAPLELAALFVFDEPLVIHSAHEVPTALNHFELMIDLIDKSPDLSKKCLPPNRTNGKEAIRLRSGPTLKFRARGKNSGRGLTGNRLVFDEAFKIDPASMGALLPTLRAMRNTQITYASSAPKADSLVLHSLIKRGRSTDDPADRLFYAEWGNEKGTALDDVDAWYQANPALGLIRSNGSGVEESTMWDEYRSLVASGDEELMAEFAREAVGIGEEPNDGSNIATKLPADKWAATVRPDHQLPKPEVGKVTVTFAVDHDGISASTAVGVGSQLDPYVEVTEFAKGTGWLPAAVVDMVRKWEPLALACNGAGATGAQVGPVIAALRDAGLDIEVQQLGAKDWARACQGFFVDVVEGRLRRPGGQGPLDVAAGDAAERPVGDGWAWDARQATVALSPLEAVTAARAVLPADVTVDVAMNVW